MSKRLHGEDVAKPPSGGDLMELLFCSVPKPTVKVYVGSEKKEFTVPRHLLCDSSPFFRAAFTGNFKEGKEQTMYLEDETVEIFYQLLEYLVSGDVDFGKGKANDTNDQSAAIDKMLNLARAANEWQIAGATEKLSEKMKPILVGNRTLVNSTNLNLALTFPRDDHVRKLFIKAVVRGFFWSGNKGGKFRFRKELKEDDSFAADLAREVADALLTSRNEHQTIDPLSMDYFSY